MIELDWFARLNQPDVSPSVRYTVLTEYSTLGPRERTVLCARGLAALPEDGETYYEYQRRLLLMAPICQLPALTPEPMGGVVPSVGWYSKFSGLGPPPPLSDSLAANSFSPSLSPLISLEAGGLK